MATLDLGAGILGGVGPTVFAIVGREGVVWIFGTGARGEALLAGQTWMGATLV